MDDRIGQWGGEGSGEDEPEHDRLWLWFGGFALICSILGYWANA